MTEPIPVRMAAPGYPPELTAPMRAELTNAGVESLETPEQVDAAIAGTKGTILVLVNSVCGCAAGQARPGVIEAISHESKPDRVATVFAGVDREATQQARSHFKGYQPSSPQIALLRDGEVVLMLERHHVENASAEMIANVLRRAFETYCKD